MQARQGHARFAGLARRKAPRQLAPKAHRPQAKRCSAPRPVASRMWFAAPSSASCTPPGSGSWTTKRARPEDCAQDAARHGRLEPTMEHRAQVRDHQVHTLVHGVRGRDDGGGVRRPHRRSARSDSEQQRPSSSRVARATTSASAPEKPSLRRSGDVRPRLRREHRLRHAQGPATRRIFARPSSAAARGLPS